MTIHLNWNTFIVKAVMQVKIIKQGINKTMTDYIFNNSKIHDVRCGNDYQNGLYNLSELEDTEIRVFIEIVSELNIIDHFMILGLSKVVYVYFQERNIGFTEKSLSDLNNKIKMHFNPARVIL